MKQRMFQRVAFSWKMGVIVGLLSLFLASNLAIAADLPGAKDHPLLKRFGGSEIVGYQTKRFDTYELQTSTYKRYNFETKRREYVKPPLLVEGALTRIWYEAAGDTSSTELFRNYQNELKAAGFKMLYDSTKDPAATQWSVFLKPFGEMMPQTNRSKYIFFAADQKGIRVASAKLSRPQGDIYVSITAVEWPKDENVYKAKRGAYIAVDIIEVAAMTENMVTVKAEEMEKSIASDGRVILYGIFFESNKAEIKPESKPTLDEIAKFMKKNPTLKLLVVGHTDNVGGFKFNMELSKRRAEAVVAKLTKDYGIASHRLIPYGVAYLAPVGVNTTEEGRAKNRRVELVPQ